MDEAASIGRYYNKRLKSIESVLQKPRTKISSEDIHKLRVEIKKMKAFTQQVQYCAINFRKRKFLKPYAKLFNEAGSVRELQIELSVLKKLNVLHALKSYAEHLKSLAKKAKHDFLSLVDASLVQKLEAGSNMVVSCFPVVNEKAVREFLEMKSREMDKLVGNNELKEEQVHKLRKILKDFYYTRLIFHAKDDTFKCMDAFQELLGQWHDIIVTLNYLQRAIDAGNLSNEENKHIVEVMHVVSAESTRLLKSIKLQIPDFMRAKQQSLNAHFSQ